MESMQRIKHVMNLTPVVIWRIVSKLVLWRLVQDYKKYSVIISLQQCLATHFEVNVWYNLVAKTCAKEACCLNEKEGFNFQLSHA